MLGLILNLSWSRVEQKLGHNIAIAQYIPSPSYEAIATTEPIDFFFYIYSDFDSHCTSFIMEENFNVYSYSFWL